MRRKKAAEKICCSPFLPLNTTIAGAFQEGFQFGRGGRTAVIFNGVFQAGSGSGKFYTGLGLVTALYDEDEACGDGIAAYPVDDNPDIPAKGNR